MKINGSISFHKLKGRNAESPDFNSQLSSAKPSHVRNKITLVEMKQKDNLTPLKTEANSVGKITKRNLAAGKHTFNFEATKHINLNIQTSSHQKPSSNSHIKHKD
jgi:hypothetical protein